jgi:phenylacetate-CoA ligase
VMVAGVSLVERTLTAIPQIQQLQLVQPRLDRVVARVVLADRDGREVASRQLTRALDDAFAGQVSVQVDIVEALEQVGRGKYRFAICEC